MASGKLNAVDLLANTDTKVYTVPAGKITAANINFVNRGTTQVTVRLALSSAVSTPANADYIEYEVTLAPSGVLERTALVMSAGESVFARASLATVSVRVHGYEENA